MAQTAIALAAPYLEDFGLTAFSISVFSLPTMPFTIMSAYGDSQSCHVEEVYDYIYKVKAICDHKALLKAQAMAAAF